MAAGRTLEIDKIYSTASDDNAQRFPKPDKYCSIVVKLVGKRNYEKTIIVDPNGRPNPDLRFTFPGNSPQLDHLQVDIKLNYVDPGHGHAIFTHNSGSARIPIKDILRHWNDQQSQILWASYQIDMKKKRKLHIYYKFTTSPASPPHGRKRKNILFAKLKVKPVHAPIDDCFDAEYY